MALTRERHTSRQQALLDMHYTDLANRNDYIPFLNRALSTRAVSRAQAKCGVYGVVTGDEYLTNDMLGGGGNFLFEPDVENPIIYPGNSQVYSLLGDPITVAEHIFRHVAPEIETAIQEAAYITDLPDNWDEEGAKQISLQTFTAAASFLREYSRYLSTLGKSLTPPEINPCCDSTIDLSWRTEQARMLINIRLLEKVPYAFFYGDRYHNKIPLKGNTPVDEFSEPLAVWMKYLA